MSVFCSSYVSTFSFLAGGEKKEVELSTVPSVNQTQVSAICSPLAWRGEEREEGGCRREQTAPLMLINFLRTLPLCHGLKNHGSGDGKESKLNFLRLLKSPGSARRSWRCLTIKRVQKLLWRRWMYKCSVFLNCSLFCSFGLAA